MRALVVAVAGAVGALFAVGCAIAILFELQGFGRARDTDPRTAYLLALAVGFAVCVGLPVLVWRALLPDSAPGWGLAAVPLVAGVLLVLGISLLR